MNESSNFFVWLESSGSSETGLFKGAWLQSALVEKQTKQLRNVSY